MMDAAAGAAMADEKTGEGAGQNGISRRRYTNRWYRQSDGTYLCYAKIDTCAILSGGKVCMASARQQTI